MEHKINRFKSYVQFSRKNSLTKQDHNFISENFTFILRYIVKKRKASPEKSEIG